MLLELTEAMELQFYLDNTLFYVIWQQPQHKNNLAFLLMYKEIWATSVLLSITNDIQAHSAHYTVHTTLRKLHCTHP